MSKICRPNQFSREIQIPDINFAPAGGFQITNIESPSDNDGTYRYDLQMTPTEDIGMSPDSLANALASIDEQLSKPNKFEKAFLDLLGLVANCANFSNGNTDEHGIIDEGNVKSWDYIERLCKDTYGLTMQEVLDEKVYKPNMPNMPNLDLKVKDIQLAPSIIQKWLWDAEIQDTVALISFQGNVVSYFEDKTHINLFRKVNVHGSSYQREYYRDADNSVIDFKIFNCNYCGSSDMTTVKILNSCAYDLYMGLNPDRINDYLRVESQSINTKDVKVFLNGKELKRASVTEDKMRPNKEQENFDPNMIFNITLPPVAKGTIRIGNHDKLDTATIEKIREQWKMFGVKCTCGGHKAKELCYDWCDLRKK